MTQETAAVREIAGGPFELGEGPHYERETDAAWWLDILGKTLLEHRFATGETVAHALPRMASVVARVDDARQLLAMDDGIYLRHRADGSLRLLAPLEAENAGTRSNDGRTHPSGALWIGTMGRRAEPGAGAIYCCAGAAVDVLFRDITIPNSICFSPDGATGYFADSAQNTIFRVAVSPEDGRPIGQPEAFLTSDAAPSGGAFDGSVVDADGVLWNAAWGGGSVTGFTPAGERVRTLAVPARQATCPCFVGPSLDKMLVTSAYEGLDAAARAADPKAGRVFLIDGGFNGRTDAPFALAGA